MKRVIFSDSKEQVGLLVALVVTSISKCVLCSQLHCFVPTNVLYQVIPDCLCRKSKIFPKYFEDVTAQWLCAVTFI